MSGHSRLTRSASRRPAAVGVQRQVHGGTDFLPDLAGGLDVDLDRPAADLDLQAGIALALPLGGDPRDLVGGADAGRIIGGHDL
jgi:hypothetical protein